MASPTIKHPVRFFFKGILYRFFMGWVVSASLSRIIPKKKNLVVCIPRSRNAFAGNTKYMFLYLLELKETKRENIEVFYLCENRKLYDDLREHGLPVLFFPGWKAVWTLLRADVVFVECNEWCGRHKVHLTEYSFRVQMWHGAGMKKVGLANPEYVNESRSGWLRIYHRIVGRIPRYQLLVLASPSQAQEKAHMFRYRDLLINGQPRNDVLFHQYSPKVLLGTDQELLDQVLHLKGQGYRAILYSPTWRKYEGSAGLRERALDFARLSAFCKDHKLIFILKDHPKSPNCNIQGYDHLFEYDKNKDIYPLFRHIDLMITDYSSIYTDFLLLDKPVLFYCYDYEAYSGLENRLAFDYSEVTPGPKCFTQDELENRILELLDGHDHYADQRKEVLNQFYQYQDGHSSQRLWECVKTKIRGS